MGLSRQEYWSGLPFPSPGDLPHKRLNRSLLHCVEPPRKYLGKYFVKYKTKYTHWQMCIFDYNFWDRMGSPIPFLGRPFEHLTLAKHRTSFCSLCPHWKLTPMLLRWKLFPFSQINKIMLGGLSLTDHEARCPGFPSFWAAVSNVGELLIPKPPTACCNHITLSEV